MENYCKIAFIVFIILFYLSSYYLYRRSNWHKLKQYKKKFKNIKLQGQDFAVLGRTGYKNSLSIAFENNGIYLRTNRFISPFSIPVFIPENHFDSSDKGKYMLYELGHDKVQLKIYQN